MSEQNWGKMAMLVDKIYLKDFRSSFNPVSECDTLMIYLKRVDIGVFRLGHGFVFATV